MKRPSWLSELPGTIHGYVTIVAWLALLVVFALDEHYAAAYAVPLLYLPILLLGLVAPGPRFALVLAAGATTLTAIDLAQSLHDSDMHLALFNRGLATAAMWITAIGATMYRLASDRRAESTRSLEDLKRALDQSAIVATTDVSGRIKFVNEKFCEISKFRRDQLIGQDLRVLNSGFHSPEFIANLWRTIGAGEVWRGELRNRASDGSIYWLDTTIVPFLDARGQPWQYMAIHYDVTDRKAQEQRLRNQAALAALGEFSAVVAHEVRNPLSGIRNAVQLMASELPAGSDGRSLGKEIVTSIDALNAVIQDLLTFARPHAMAFSPVVVHAFAFDLANTFRQDPAMREIEVELTGDVGLTVDADADQLRLVFMNLLINAGQAMAGRGRISVHIERAPGDACAISVMDRGGGVPKELHGKVFEPFFTTKHRGTGLGLPTVRRVIEAHHGSVALADRPGGGTIARVVLPCRQPALIV